MTNFKPASPGEWKIINSSWVTVTAYSCPDPQQASLTLGDLDQLDGDPFSLDHPQLYLALSSNAQRALQSVSLFDQGAFRDFWLGHHGL